MTENSPEEKSLRTVSFIVHATRGVVRDQNVRRRTMFILLVIALVLLFSGSTFLATTITPREHPVWFVLFWLVCGWLTMTAMLLAVFDLLMVRLAARKSERTLRGDFPQSESPDAPKSRSDE